MKNKIWTEENTRWDFIFLSIKQRKQIVNFSYYIWFQFYTYNISYSTREKFINLSWVGIQCDLYCIQREVFVVIFECTDFFLTSLIMKDITLEFWKVRTFILKVFKHGLNYYFWQIYLHICQLFFSNAIIMHILYMHAFSPYHFTSNCFNSYISCKLHSPSYKKKYAINILDFLTED